MKTYAAESSSKSPNLLSQSILGAIGTATSASPSSRGRALSHDESAGAGTTSHRRATAEGNHDGAGVRNNGTPPAGAGRGQNAPGPDSHQELAGGGGGEQGAGGALGGRRGRELRSIAPGRSGPGVP